MTPLSPAAQAVLDAVLDEAAPLDEQRQTKTDAAAALRAAADLVAPENYKCFTGHVDWDLGSEARSDAIRDELLAIAAELGDADNA